MLIRKLEILLSIFIDINKYYTLIKIQYLYIMFILIINKVKMFYIRSFSIVPYSSKQMFNLINDVGSYAEFVPGFNIIKILKQCNGELIAEISLITNGIFQSLVTHNFFIKDKSIIIFLINSPFKSFYGCWQFIPITNKISSVEYITYYEFKSIFIEKIFNYAFQKICRNIIQIFVGRANQIYGITITR